MIVGSVGRGGADVVRVAVGRWGKLFQNVGESARRRREKIGAIRSALRDAHQGSSGMAPDGPPGGGGRNAEHAARRVSSCAFADNVAEAAMMAYDAALARLTDHESGKDRGQTVLAAVVARDGRVTPPIVRVVSLGAGTKFLGAADIDADTQAGVRVRDCHAEVLARRGMKRFLYAQIRDAACGRERNESAEQARPGGSGRPGKDIHWNVLERSPGELSNVDTQANPDKVTSEKLGGWRCAPGVTFHLYASSAPCGNACVKRFARGGKEVFDESGTKFDVPPEAHDHGVPKFGAVRDGQLAFLWKRDPGENTENTENTKNPGENTESTTTEMENTTDGTRHLDPKITKQVVPPGCSTTGRVLTCSDKIAVWSCVGFQGSLLLARGLLVEPVFFDSIVVGRKFTAAICRRALCCRMKKFFDNKTRASTTKFTRTKHPAVLCTAKPFDKGVFQEGQGARFADGNGIVAWLENENLDFAEKLEPVGRESKTDAPALPDAFWVIDLVDGRSGKRVSGVGGDRGTTDIHGNDGNGNVSGVARAALEQAHAFATSAVFENLENENGAKENDANEKQKPEPVSYAERKAAASAVSGYAEWKREALSQPGLWTLSAPHRNARVAVGNK